MTKINTKILNFGSLNIDYVYNVENFVQPGETILSNKFAVYTGGKGNNQSIALAKAGAKVYHAGIIGKDGQFLLDNLNKHSVNTDYIIVDNNQATGHAIIQVNSAGENCIILHGGANQTVSEQYINQVFANFNDHDILLIQNEISNMSKIIELASQKNMQIYFNPAPMEKKIFGYPLDKIDSFIVNESEGYALTGKTEPNNIIKEMAKLFPNSKVILTLGEQGVIYNFQDVYIKQPAYKTNVVDTTAAGDTFLGYYIASLQKGFTIEQALEVACKASSLTVANKGATDSIPCFDEINFESIDQTL